MYIRTLVTACSTVFYLLSFSFSVQVSAVLNHSNYVCLHVAHYDFIYVYVRTVYCNTLCIHACVAQFHAVVGVLTEDTDPMVSVMKLEKAPLETYGDIGGLDQQIQEIKVCIRTCVTAHEKPTTHRKLNYFFR